MELKFVDCSYIYWEFVRNLRNNPLVVKGFIDQNYIEISKHQNYMTRKSSAFTVVLESGEPVAYYRVIHNDISFCVHPDYQCKGIGSTILNRIIKKFPDSYGKVKSGNDASSKAFCNAGYKETYVIYKIDNDIQEHSS